MKKYLLTLIIAASLSACSNDNKTSAKDVKDTTGTTNTQKPSNDNKKASATDMQGVSYIIGYDLGNNFKKSNIDVNKDSILEGIKAGASGTTPKYSETEMQKTMQEFQKSMQLKAMAKQKEQEQKTTQLVISDLKTLTNDPKTPYIGPKVAKVAVIEFFDYQCAYCSLIAPAVEQSITHNPNVKFVFKDYPIFGQRWSSSYYAADMGVIAFQQGGSDLYKKYHDGIFATGHDEGKLTKEDIDKVAKDIGVNTKNLKNNDLGDTLKTLPETVAASSKLGQSLGFQGTPALIIMPTENPTAENTTIFFGYPANPEAGPKAAAAAIDAAIQKALRSSTTAGK